MHLRKLPILLPALAGLFAAAAHGQAQAPAAGQTDDGVTQLPRFQVTAEPIDSTVIPLGVQGSDVMGDSRGPLETPRAATFITPALMAENGIDSVAGLADYSPGALRIRPHDRPVHQG
jgi:hypothetical protein